MKREPITFSDIALLLMPYVLMGIMVLVEIWL